MGDELFDMYNLYNSKKYYNSNSTALNGVYTSDVLDDSWLGVTTTATSADWSYQGTKTSEMLDDWSSITYNFQANKIYEILSYLSEEDILTIIKRIKERECPEEFIKYFIRELMQKRSFSEKFLIELYDYLDLDLVKKLYNSQIKSQEFSELALLIAAK